MDFPPNALGGAEQIAYSFSKELARMGHEITVFTTTTKRETVGTQNEEGMHVIRVYSDYHPRWRAYISLYNPQTIPHIKELLKKESFDVIHAHNVHQYISYHALKLASRSCPKVFLTAHDAMMIAYGKLYPQNHDCKNPDYPTGFFQQLKEARLWFNPFRGIFIRYYLRYVTKILCVSNTLERILNTCGIINTITFYNGIEIPKEGVPIEKVESFKEKYQLIGKQVIFFGGRVSFGKGGGQALKYIQAVLKNVPQAILIIAGRENETVSLIRARAKEMRIEKSVVCVGWLSRDEMRYGYTASDAVIVPSLCLDNFPTTNLEAMIAGKPVIATCFGGSCEAIVNGETGYIENPYDINGWVARIEEFLLDATKAQSFGKAGRERVCAHFDITDRAHALIELFELSKRAV